MGNVNWSPHTRLQQTTPESDTGGLEEREGGPTPSDPAASLQNTLIILWKVQDRHWILTFTFQLLLILIPTIELLVNKCGPRALPLNCTKCFSFACNHYIIHFIRISIDILLQQVILYDSAEVSPDNKL